MSETKSPSVAVLGAGTWGAVLAHVAAQNDFPVTAWDFFPDVIEKLKADRNPPNLPAFELDERVQLSSDLEETLTGAQMAVLVVPSTSLRANCETIRERGLASSIKTWVVCSKGVEQQTLLPLHEVVIDVLGDSVRSHVGVLSGPSHAEEVSRGLPTTVTACSENPEVAAEIQRVFFQPRFRVYTHDDVLGVELGGALKNVIAIAAGISDGMGFGDNTRAALITRGLAEIVRLGTAMGARRDTFMGLSGMGDLVVTTSSPHSRNHRFGEYLAQGLTCEEALEEVGMVVEGYATSVSAYELSKKFEVEMPITDAVYHVIHKDLPAREGLERLLARDPKSETE